MKILFHRGSVPDKANLILQNRIILIPTFWHSNCFNVVSIYTNNAEAFGNPNQIEQPRLILSSLLLLFTIVESSRGFLSKKLPSVITRCDRRYSDCVTDTIVPEFLWFNVKDSYAEIHAESKTLTVAWRAVMHKTFSNLNYLYIKQISAGTTWFLKFFSKHASALEYF